MIAAIEALPDLTDGQQVAQLAAEVGADLVVIGPEVPLVAGVADTVRAAGIACYGPSAQAAELEGSKAFAKDIMSAAGIPTGLAHVCSDVNQVIDAIDCFGPPYVVKEDGLAAGKGVVVTTDREAALSHARTCLDKPGGAVVVEEFLDGPEVSLFCICDGRVAVPLAPAQDFKRVGEDDTGPNTGGMGAYTPLDWAPADLVDTVMTRIAAPLLQEMARRGTPFSGTLFVGLALTRQGPKVIEFNVRFGDPETQVVLARLATPLAGVLYAAATGTLADQAPLRWSADSAVTVVLAAENYPGTPRVGDRISGLRENHDEDGEQGAYVLQAGTAFDSEGALVSAGGRVLSVVGTGADLAAARAHAYAAIGAIDLPGSHYRRDIAAKAERGEVLPESGVQMNEEAIEAFWNVARERARLSDLEVPLGPNPLGLVPPPTWSYGDSPGDADRFVDAIVRQGSASISAPDADYAQDGRPKVGDVSIILDGSGAPRALVAITASDHADGQVTSEVTVLYQHPASAP